VFLDGPPPPSFDLHKHNGDDEPEDSYNRKKNSYNKNRFLFTVERKFETVMWGVRVLYTLRLQYFGM
jgi:hypothetical protein